MHSDDDDDTAALVLRTLADPLSLKLILHLLRAGECDSTVGRQLQMDPRPAALRLDRLVAAGLIVPAQAADGVQRYRLADAAAVERLLASVRQLGTR